MIGRGVNRVDGPAKVTGRAIYAYEHQEKDMLYGVILTATIARGHIESIDTADAERAPGVQAVLTYENVPAQGMRDESIMWHTGELTRRSAALRYTTTATPSVWSSRPHSNKRRRPHGSSTSDTTPHQGISVCTSK